MTDSNRITQAPGRVAATAYNYSDDTLWMIHVLGPDDIYAAPSLVEAYEQAAKYQRFFDGRKDKHEHDPIVRAVVTEWDGTPEQHAHNLTTYWKDFAWPPLATGVLDEAQERSWFESQRGIKQCYDLSGFYAEGDWAYNNHLANAAFFDGWLPAREASIASSPPWIPVTERLPEQRAEPYQVLVACVKRMGGMYEGKPVRRFIQDWAVRQWPQNFTHWMEGIPFPALDAAPVATGPGDAN